MTQQKIYVAEKDLRWKKGEFDPTTGNFWIECPCCKKTVPMYERSRKKGLLELVKVMENKWNQKKHLNMNSHFHKKM